jgi:hypothetical protein
MTEAKTLMPFKLLSRRSSCPALFCASSRIGRNSAAVCTGATMVFCVCTLLDADTEDCAAATTGFGNGLPVAVGRSRRWRSCHSQEVRDYFARPAQPPQPVTTSVDDTCSRICAHRAPSRRHLVLLPNSERCCCCCHG